MLSIILQLLWRVMDLIWIVTNLQYGYPSISIIQQILHILTLYLLTMYLFEKMQQLSRSQQYWYMCISLLKLFSIWNEYVSKGWMQNASWWSESATESVMVVLTTANETSNDCVIACRWTMIFLHHFPHWGFHWYGGF